MDIHYNAFISYRHHPDDIRVASQIHRSLEHYKVPKALRQKNKGITRIFRDKEELPITSNLTDDITRALENSDFLIVICSTHTRESTWVQREIETFLKTHDRNKVLTVLVDGEPYDTIPEILLHEQRTDPVTGQTVSVPIEPLSCDWRIPLRKAKREELPRLAAALLNCGYDELRQRERQYRTRRMVAAFSLALAISLGFLAYFIYSNTRIRQANDQLFSANLQITENLEQALKNQSQFLANASSDELDSGDRLTAMLLALEALPEYEGERPYVATAEDALATAVGAYLADSEVKAVGAFDCKALVKDFRVTEDGGTIYILDERSNLSVWNTETFQQISSRTLPASYTSSNPQLFTTASGNVLFFAAYDRALICCDPDGHILWQTNDCSDIAFLGGQDTLMLLNNTYMTDDGAFLSVIRFLDANTGEPVREDLIFEEDPSRNNASFLMETYPAGAAIAVDLSYSDRKSSAALDPATGKLTTLATYNRNALITCTGYTADGNIVLAVNEDSTGSSSGYYLNMIITAPAYYDLQCFTPSGRSLWTNRITSYIYGFANTIQPIPGSSQLFCLINNVMCVLDSATGQILGQCETSSSPLYANVKETYATVFLRDGSNGSYSYSSNMYSAIQYSKNNLDLATINHGLYTHEHLNKQIIVYRSVRDEAYLAYTGDYGDLSIRRQLTHGNLLAIETYTGIYLFDAESRKLLWSDGGDYSFDTNILGFSDDGRTLWCIRDDENAVAYDTRTGTSREYFLPAQAEYPNIYYQDQNRMAGTGIFCTGKVYSSPDEMHLIRWDTVTREYRDYLICASDSIRYDSKVLVLAADNTRALLWENINNLILQLDLASGRVTTVATDVATRPTAHILDESRFLLGCSHEIQIRSFGGEILTRVDLGEKNAVSFCPMGNMFLVQCDDGDIYRYAENGTFLSKTGIHLYNTFYSNITSSNFDPSQLSWFFTEKGDLIVNAFNYGNVIDCTDWNLKASIPNLITYLPARNELVIRCSSEDVPDIVAYRLRSTEELRQMALEALNGRELTEEQRFYYGLSE